MPQSIETTLAERGARYGSFIGHATITQLLKHCMNGLIGTDFSEPGSQDALRDTLLDLNDKWNSLAPDQRECLEMIAHKIGRILNGDPNYDDSWRDIVGYAQLVVNRLVTEQTQAVVEAPKRRGRPAQEKK